MWHEMCIRDRDFSGILTKGGTILGTSRTPFKTIQDPDPNGLNKVEAMKQNYYKLQLDCLVILGGNGTHKTANLLRKEGLKMCIRDSPEGLDSTIWKEGGVDTSTAAATDTGSRFGIATGTYINLTKVAEIGETKTASVPVYNYVTTNGDDWDIYTLITTAEEFVAIGQDTANCNACLLYTSVEEVHRITAADVQDTG